MMKYPRLIALFVALLCLCATGLRAQQDTLQLSLRMADSLMITNNLSLIASRYDIDKAKAQVIAAEVFANPEFSAESFLYSPDHHGVFDPSFQKIFSIQQLFRLAGQHGLGIDLAKEQEHMSTLQFEQLVRSLKYQLHTTYYTIYFLTNALRALSSQLDRLHGTVVSYQLQYQKGNFSLKELTRLKSTLFELTNGNTQLQQDLSDAQKNMHIFIGSDRPLAIIPSKEEVRVPSLPTQSVDDLVRLAIENRTDVALSKSSLKQSELRLSLEKSKAWPDMHVGLDFDQAGTVVNNYLGINVGFDLPIFDRNQGGIAEAQADLRQTESEHKATELQVRQEVASCVEKLKSQHDQYVQVGNTLVNDVDTLSESVLQNYLNGNLSLLEFTDLFESYNSSIIDINRFYASLFSSYEDLNYAVGKELFR